MDNAKYEVVFGRLKELYDEESNWKLFALRYMGESTDMQKEIIYERLKGIEEERNHLLDQLK